MVLIQLEIIAEVSEVLFDGFLVSRLLFGEGGLEPVQHRDALPGLQGEDFLCPVDKDQGDEHGRCKSRSPRPRASSS